MAHSKASHQLQLILRDNQNCMINSWIRGRIDKVRSISIHKTVCLYSRMHQPREGELAEVHDADHDVKMLQNNRSIDQKSIDKLSILSFVVRSSWKLTVRGFSVALITNLDSKFNKSINTDRSLINYRFCHIFQIDLKIATGIFKDAIRNMVEFCQNSQSVTNWLIRFNQSGNYIRSMRRSVL